MAVQFSEKSSERIRYLLHCARGKKALVLGSGITGLAVAKLLAAAGYQLTVLDENPVRSETRRTLENLKAEIIENFSVSDQGPKFLAQKEFRFAVSSPGMAPDGALIQSCLSAGIQLLSEVDLAVAYLGHPQVAVTGTNGKTTTVHLIHEMFKAAGFETGLVGNVGNPFVNLIDPQKIGREEEPAAENHLVAEVSSYQLETAQSFAPQIGVILNIQPDHLERHGSIEEYIRAKGKIFGEQEAKSDWSVVFADDIYARELKAAARGQLMLFGMFNPERATLENGCWYRPEERDILLCVKGRKETYDLAKFKLLGTCNRFNLAAAIAAARLAGASQAAVQQVIESFDPLEHRLERVSNTLEKVFINDSKATNIHSTLAALEAVRSEYAQGDVVLLLGGLAKICDWAELVPGLSSRVRHVITFGASGDKIADELSALFARDKIRVLLHRAKDLSEATTRANKLSRAGDIVLMAPACASFDSYANYAERGRDFRRAVGDLTVEASQLTTTSGEKVAECR